MSALPSRDPRRVDRRTFLRRSGAVAVGLTAALLFAGCGSSSTSTTPSDSVTPTTSGDNAAAVAARANLDAARGMPTFTPPGPPVDASKAAGKKIFYLAVTMNVPIVQTWWKGIENAAAAAGLTATSFDGKGNPTEYVRGFDQAIAQKYDVIIIESIPSDSIAEPIKRAQEAGIKVIIGNERNAEDGGPVLDTVDAGVSMPYGDAADLEADWVIADANGSPGEVAVFRMPNVAAHDAMVDRIEAKFAGTGLKVVTIEEVAIPDWSSRLPTLTRTLLTQYPDLQYIVPLVDGMALNIVPALEQANKADQVKISTFNATPAVMKLMRDGSPVKADVGGANTWEGWAYVDQSLRLLTGAEPVEQNVPLRMFDTTNVDTIDVDGNEDDWYDTQKAIDGYKQLWGVG
jgi:ribose transport system substrate-binding protein